MANLKSGRNLILNSSEILMKNSDGGSNRNVAEFKDGYVSIIPIATGNVYLNPTIPTSLPMEKGQTYTLSFQASTYGPTGLYWYPSESYVKSAYIPDTNGEWLDVSFTYTQTNDTRANPSLWGFHGLQPGKEVRYTPPKLEIGSEATPWTPAPEDLELEYPGHVTHFGTYFKDNDMVTDELIEYPEELRGGRNLITGTNEPMPFSSPNSTIKYIGDFQSEKHVYEIINPYGYVIFHSPEKYSETLEDAKNGDIYIFSVRVMVGDIVGTASEAIYLGGKFGSNYININEGASLSSERFTTISRTAPIIDETKSNQRIHIRLNKYDKIYVSSKVKLEKGSTATPWTPATEDLGLEYPSYITHFGTYFKESDIFEDSLVGGRNLIPNSKEERFDGSGKEFKQYVDLAPILEKYGLNKTYSLSLEVKSLDPSISNSVQVYMQNGSGTKYNFVNHSIAVTKEFQRFTLEGLTPTLTGMADTRATLAFYGRYDTGNFPIVRNVKLELGDRATHWTPAPEDLGLNYPPSITYFENNPQIQNVVSNEFVEFHKDNRGFDLRNPVDKISGEEIYTDQADDSVVHVEVDAKSYQNAGSGKNLYRTKELKSLNATSWAVTAYMYNFKLKPNTEYTLSSNVPFSANEGSVQTVLYFNGTNTSSNGVYDGKSNTQTTDSTGNIYIATPVGRSYTEPLRNGEYWVQLEEGSTATTYEPPAPTPDYPIEIHSLNDFDVVSSVGGRNYVLNSDRELSSSNSLIMVPINNVARLYPLIGEIITISFDIRADEPIEDIDCYLRNNSSATIVSGANSPKFNVSESFERYSYSFELVDITKLTNMSFAIRGFSDVSRYVRNIKLEKGNKATDWTPAPENIAEDDNHSLIDKINLLLDEPLRSVGDVKDILFRDSSDGLWKIERKIISKILDNNTLLSTSGAPSYEGVLSTNRYVNLQSGEHARGHKDAVYEWCSHLPHNDGVWGDDYKILGTSVNASHQFHIRMPNSTLGILTSDSLNARTQKFKDFFESEKSKGTPFLIQYQAAESSIKTEVLPQPLQDKLNNLRTFKDSNYVYTVLPDKINILSENLEPTLHATFKSEDYGKLAKDGLVYPDDITHLATKINYGTMIVSELIEGGGAYGNSTTGL